MGRRAWLVVVVVVATAACADPPRRSVVTTRGAALVGRRHPLRPPRPASAAPVVQLAAGPAFACARHADGAMSCWGDNRAGQLGHDVTADAAVPVERKIWPAPVGAPIDGVTAIAAWKDRACAVKDAAVWCWGGPDRDPVRIAGTEAAVEVAGPCARDSAGAARCWLDSLAADPVPDLGTRLVDLAGSSQHACGLDAHGHVGCVELVGSYTVPDLQADAPGAVEVAIRDDRQTCVRLATGAIACWNLGEEAMRGGPTMPAYTVDGVAHATQLVAGADFMCAREQDGAVACWGNYPGPPRMSYPSDIAATRIDGLVADELAAGGEFVCARRGGEVRCIGAGGDGQLGTGRSAVQAIPAPVAGVTDAIDVEVGDRISCARRRNGDVACWGVLQIAYAQVTSPAPTHQPALHGAVALSGRVDVCARMPGGEVRCGCGRSDGSAIATDVSELARGAAGGVVIKRDGRVRFWAVDDPSYEDGVPATSDHVVLPPLPGATRVARGEDDLCVGQPSGVVCFDRAALGQAFAGDVPPVGAPVPGLGRVEQLAWSAGVYCALVPAGTVACWGESTAGLLGAGVERSRAAVSIPGLDGVVQLAGGTGPMCARTAAGAVRCWGDNADGVLGDPFRGPSSAEPVTIALPPVVDVAVGRHACAVTAGGEVWCWGAAASGQTGTRIDQRVFPVDKVAFAAR